MYSARLGASENAVRTLRREKEGEAEVAAHGVAVKELHSEAEPLALPEGEAEAVPLEKGLRVAGALGVEGALGVPAAAPGVPPAAPTLGDAEALAAARDTVALPLGVAEAEPEPEGRAEAVGGALRLRATEGEKVPLTVTLPLNT